MLPDEGEIFMIFTKIVTIGITIVLITLIRKLVKEKGKDSSKITQPRLYLNGGLFSCVIFTVLVFAMPYLPTADEYDLPSWILFYTLFTTLALAGLSFIVYYVNWGITLQEDTFIYSNFFGKKVKYSYKDCLSYVKSARVDIYDSKDKKRLFSISLLSPGWDKVSGKVPPYMKKYQE